MARHKVRPLTPWTARTRRHLGSQAASRLILWRSSRTLRKVLRNSLLSCCCSWLFAFCIARGDVFSSLEPDQQSYETFVMGKLMWFWVFCWVFTLAECVAKLLPEPFATQSTQATLSVAQILVKLARPILLPSIGVLLVSIAGSLGIAWLSPSDRKYKADVYWGMLGYHFILTVTDAHTRHIFRLQTVSGQAKERRRSRQPRSVPPVSRPRRSPSSTQFFRVFLQNSALVASAFLAGAYVHVMSFVRLRNRWELAAFAICSQSLKLVVQGLAKLYLSKRRRTPSMRTMALIIAVPTILVDTQLRTVLLCLDSNALTLVSSVLLAVAKIVLRLARTLIARRQARQILAPHPSAVSVLPQGGVDAQLTRSPSTFSSSPQVQAIARVHKLMALHAAEVYADMHGEYIAMGCSYGILLFLGSSRRFQLGGNASMSTTHHVHLATVGLQVGLEVVGDFVAIPLELHMGVNFESFNKDDVFLALLIVLIAVVNIHIASGIYLRPQ
ncbi:hypothetical protein BBJ28_00016376 [Nothophytophthora sp. Chile5]|nr:hypothetical protein BBJ28_00016376 [Nothophytophthora sp. Chile5]